MAISETPQFLLSELGSSLFYIVITKNKSIYSIVISVILGHLTAYPV